MSDMVTVVMLCVYSMHSLQVLLSAMEMSRTANSLLQACWPSFAYMYMCHIY